MGNWLLARNHMAKNDQKAVPTDPPRAGNALQDLVRELAGLNPPPDDAPISADEAADGRAEVELKMADLVSDANGEIVFFNDSGFRSLGITTEASVVADGEAQAHRTADGTDVTGFFFVTFENGLTIYYQDGLDLILHTS